MKPRFLTLLACTPLLGPAAVRASTSAYGSINNFDAVNDTGKVCHGFEIELEDLHSTDVTCTFEWNHYGTPEIHENNTIPAYPVTTVRYLSKKNPDGS